MGFNDFLRKMKIASDDEQAEDEYDEYDEYEDDEDEEPVEKKHSFFSRSKKKEDSYDEDTDNDSYNNSGSDTGRTAYRPTAKTLNMKGHYRNAELSMIVPKNYDDATMISDALLRHRAVVLNLEGIDISAAQRIVDFASGACYTVGGTLQKISKKIFILVPQDMDLSGDFDQIAGEMVDISSFK